MPLVDLHTVLEVELDSAMAVYEELATSRTFQTANDFSLADECLLEGILSRMWQSWCVFCRELTVQSCMGTHTLSGWNIPGLVQATSTEAVSWAAIQANRGRATIWGGANAIQRLEPTWGDTNALDRIASGLSPSNSIQLLALCQTSGSRAKALQIIRNAAAHNNSETRAEVARMSSRYLTFATTHPIQALFWIDPASSQYLLPNAVAKLKDAAIAVVM